MFDGEMVKRNFPFEIKFGQKFLVQDNVGLRTFLVQDKVGLRKFFLDLENFQDKDKVGLGKFSFLNILDLRHF